MGNVGLRAKIVVPYVILPLLVGIVASYVATGVMLTTWTERFNAQLFSAADEAANAIVSIESSQLNNWRQIAITEGVAEAASLDEGTTLETAIEPLALNQEIESVWVLTAQGQEI